MFFGLFFIDFFFEIVVVVFLDVFGDWFVDVIGSQCDFCDFVGDCGCEFVFLMFIDCFDDDIVMFVVDVGDCLYCGLFLILVFCCVVVVEVFEICDVD